MLYVLLLLFFVRQLLINVRKMSCVHVEEWQY